jgi:hypothetical protein
MGHASSQSSQGSRGKILKIGRYLLDRTGEVTTHDCLDFDPGPLDCAIFTDFA